MNHLLTENQHEKQEPGYYEKRAVALRCSLVVWTIPGGVWRVETTRRPLQERPVCGSNGFNDEPRDSPKEPRGIPTRRLSISIQQGHPLIETWSTRDFHTRGPTGALTVPREEACGSNGFQ